MPICTSFTLQHSVTNMLQYPHSHHCKGNKRKGEQAQIPQAPTLLESAANAMISDGQSDRKS